MNRAILLPFLVLLAVFNQGCGKPQSDPAPGSVPEAAAPTSKNTGRQQEPAHQEQEALTTESDVHDVGVPLDADVAVEYENGLTPAEIESGQILLFDNETLFGWVKENEINWTVQEGTITASEGPIGLLRTFNQFADFELRLDFKLAPGGNSGVFIRCQPGQSDPAESCYEINLADEHPDGFSTGSVVTHHSFQPSKKYADNEWHTLKISAKGAMITIMLDDSDQTVFQDDSAKPLLVGEIGLQKNAGQVAFRNIRLRPLGQTQMFSGQDLSGWREVPGSQSVIDVVNEQIHVVSGPGFLETEMTYDDFLLQFAAKTEAEELNSGLFFRAIQGTEENPSNGYEFQIHNGFKEEDRNQPNNSGTGAIFRRIEARRIVSSDNKWATMTLIANGPRISTWVEGYPVVHWEDTREPDENPRRGKRLKAGHFSLQGHDPTTDLYFKNFRVAEYPDN